MGLRTVHIGDYVVGRNGLIAEYVHRQTGESFTRRQVGSFLQVERSKTHQGFARMKVLKGLNVKSASIDTSYVSAVLGPDLFPSVPTTLALSRSAKAAQSSKKRRKPPSSISNLPPPSASASLAPKPADFTSSTPSLPSPLTRNPSRILATTDVLTPSDLAAFLTSFAPSHDFSPSAYALFCAGITSLDDLVSLLGGER